MASTYAESSVQRYPPAPALRGLVSHYWLSGDSAAATHTVLPDGCVDLVLRVANGACDLSAFGTSTRPSAVPVSAGGVYFGIRFQPGQSRHFVAVPGRLLTDSVQPLSRPAGLQAAQLTEVITQPHPASAVDRLLLRWLARHPPQFRRLDNALALLSSFSNSPNLTHLDATGPGPISVTALAERLNLSRRQLERDFVEWIGVPPKLFMGIRRSQRAMALLDRGSSDRLLADVALIAGYADQSHMTRELKRYLGVTPGTPRLPDHDVAFIQEQTRPTVQSGALFPD